MKTNPSHPKPDPEETQNTDIAKEFDSTPGVQPGGDDSLVDLEIEATTEPDTDLEEVSSEAIDSVTASLIEELTAAKIAADEARDQMLRAQAELLNFRRRKERDTAERIEQANARLIKELIPIIDDFELAFANVPESLTQEETSWVEGFDLILRKVMTLLDREGVTVIEASGEFDPNLHEAISVEPGEGVNSGHIIAEVRKGYKLRDRILRPSYVRVAQ